MLFFSFFFVDIIDAWLDGDEVDVEVDELELIDETENEEITEDDMLDLQHALETDNEEESSSQSSGYCVSPKKPRCSVELEYKEKVVFFWQNGGNIRKLSSVQHKYRKEVLDKNKLRRWKIDVEKNGNRLDKLKKLADSVHEKFLFAKKEGFIIHDLDLRRWAMEENKTILLSDFKASDHWLHCFKTKYRIRSRKITKVVSKKNYENKEKIAETAQDFVTNTALPAIKDLDPSQVYNTDQSGFSLEIHSGRTLANIGDKKVEVVVQSTHATTHSYTIMPTITMAGELLPQVMIVLNEQTGQIPPTVNVVSTPYAVVAASKSGKMSKSHVKQYYKDIFVPNLKEGKNVLAEDSWTGFKDKKLLEELLFADRVEVEVITIPAGTTGLIQPLDVYFFRIYKNFFRKISDFILLDRLPIDLKNRNTIIMLHSLCHQQFRSPRFKSMLQYSWFKCGYLPTRPDKFQTPTEYCFQNDGGLCSKCNSFKFIKCAWCNVDLCFNHFFVENPHLCDNFVR